jgi:DNA invertase Pin-like site-specific DNA recombinase
MERKGVEKGVKKGVEKGVKIGVEKGVKIGEEKGMKKEKLNMARRMLRAGESEAKILFYTEITPEELEELRREND